MKKLFTHFGIISVCAFVLLSGCQKAPEPFPEEISVEGVSGIRNAFPAESCGVKLEKSVEKAVSLSPAVTEIICELGFKERLVGISDYCDFPENLPQPKVGSTENPNIEEIIKLKPDAVFTLSSLSEREAYSLTQAGIAVLTAVPPVNLEGYSDLYKEIASAFYGKELAEGEKEEQKSVKIAADARAELENAAKSVSTESFIYVTEKLTVAGSETFENAVLSLSGVNACKSSGYASTDSADLTESAPKYIIADNSLTASDLSADAVIGGLISGGAEVKFIDGSLFERPCARTAELFGQLSGGEDVTSE